jgi:TolB-like protein/DNA-binding winged helix-turn-helix (wHTH) protein/Flp pilus assembly protein TadD
MSEQVNQLYEFGSYRLDPSERRLTEGNRQVSLTPKAFQTLLVLVENQGRVVGKEELLQKVWPDSFVEEATLAQNVFTLRKQLHDDREEAVYIETVPKRGYRFVAPVQVVGATDRQPKEFFASISEISTPPTHARTSRWMVVAVPLVVVLAGLLTWRFRPSTAVRRPLLAVLPVENLTGDPNREFLSDGLTEELIAQLGALDPGKLGVIARTSSMTYKGSGKTIPQIAQELGVDYLLEGSIREAGGKLRVTEQLVRGHDQTHLWAQSYDRDLGNMIEMQTEIAGSIASSIELRLTDATRLRFSTARPVNPAAYQAYLQGRFYWNTRTREGLLKSIDYYNQALQLDPANARAYAGLADAYNLLSFYGYTKVKANLDRATDAAHKALEFDETLPEAHAALAYANFYWWWKWPESEHDFRRAIELDSNYVPAHQWYALYLAAMGRQPEGLQQIERAKELDPLSPAVRAGAAFVDYFARHYDDALVECNTALSANSKFMPALYVRGLGYEAKGQFDKAITDFQSASDLSGTHNAIYESALAHAYALTAKSKEAERIASDLERRSTQEYIGPSNQAVIWAGLGDKQKAVEWLKRAVAANDAGTIWVRVDPRWDGVRSDPWIQAWLANPNLGAHNQ